MSSILRIDELTNKDGSGPVKASLGLQLPNQMLGGNTLDWVERGVFTPTLIGETTAGTCTYTARTGHFRRLGDVVFIRLRCDWSGHNGTGIFTVTGLPYQATWDQPLVCMTNGFPSPVVGYVMPGVGIRLYQQNNYTTHSVLAGGGLIIGGSYILGN
jgi:hypothetical protein